MNKFCSQLLEGTLLLLLITSCATPPTLTVSSQEAGSTLTLVPIDDPASNGELLTNPVELDSRQLHNKLIRIEKAGKTPQYILALDSVHASYSIRFKQLISSEKAENRNAPVRLLLKAYQALTSKDHPLAKEYARQAADLDAGLAGPHIVMGLAYLQEKNPSQARVHFLKAKALDPDDKDIHELIKSAQ